MFQLSTPWWAFVVRGVVVYVFLLVFLRLTGRRQIGQYDPLDLVLLLVLSNAVQNSMNAGDNSLIGGLISALTLIGCHLVVARLTWSSPRLARWIDGRPRVLIRDGQLDAAIVRGERLTADDVQAALRAAGCLHVHEVERATIETNGQITVVLLGRAPPPQASAGSGSGAA